MSITKKYRGKITSIENSIAGVYTLTFSSLGKPFNFSPGQFLHLALDSDYDGIGQWPESRCFSMQSNPDEPLIRITYAVKGRFTGMMEKQLSLGSEVWLKLPYGDLFTQHHNKTNTVFIAGGTGITPFLSLFTSESFNEYINPRIYIGFRSKSYNIYNKELNSAFAKATTDKFVQLRDNFVELCAPFIFYEDSEGQIDINKIFSENGTTSDYFISGPPLMIKAFKQLLNSNGVPVNQIKTDDWE